MEDNTSTVDNLDALLNPEIRKMIIGTREEETITIYPLTYYDQKKISEDIANFIVKESKKSARAGKKDMTPQNAGISLDVKFLTKLTQTLENNLPVLVEKCTDVDIEHFMSVISSGQMMSFLDAIMEVNFINPIEKGTTLLTNLGSLYGASQS